MTDRDEILEIIDETGALIGLAGRKKIHGDPSLIHRVVHVLVFNSRGNLLLQKRSHKKDISPGKWDTSVGGHVNPGESPFNAALRETREELGITLQELKLLYEYLYRDSRESEMVSTYQCRYDGEYAFNRDEIDEIRYWSIDEIRDTLGKGIFTGNFETEFLAFHKNLQK